LGQESVMMSSKGVGIAGSDRWVGEPAPGSQTARGAGPSAVEILAGVQAVRAVIQDFCPLRESIEWQLGQGYFRDRGNKAFLNDSTPVPFVINNDGNLSARAADAFFASLVAADRAGSLEPEIFVLELGIGIGLFARFFLDSFRRLCERHDVDYYERLCYVAGDYSETMLLDACRHGIFAHHPGHYAVRVVDALSPERSLARDPLFGDRAERPFHAIFLNYVLDCLPFAVLRVEGEIRQLCVRTCLARSADLSEHAVGGVAELARLAASTDPQDKRELREVFGLLASEYDYRPVDLAEVPYGDFAVQFARSTGQRSLLHNFGAIQSLERLLSLLHEQGFILVNDYGHARETGADDFEHQRFSRSTSVGLNLPLLKAYFGDAHRCGWFEPAEGETPSIYARLLGDRLAAETIARFQECFSKATLDRRLEPAQQARELLRAGRLEAALTAYQQALEHQPANWVLLNEVAHFLIYPLRSPAAGLEMVRAALSLNPTCSPDSWNLLGDALFYLERIEEAEHAYLRALQVNADDVRARFNLAYVYARTRQYDLALRRIAEALALDSTGSVRDGLLQKQSEVLGLLTQRNQMEYRRMADRISTRAEPPRPDQGKTAIAQAAEAVKKPDQGSPAPEALSAEPGPSGR
jgi:tetratricopeptide (TPR) repeat protein